MCVNKLSKVALDSEAARIEPAISSRNSQVQRPNHCATEPNGYIGSKKVKRSIIASEMRKSPRGGTRGMEEGTIEEMSLRAFPKNSQ